MKKSRYARSGEPRRVANITLACQFVDWPDGSIDSPIPASSWLSEMGNRCKYWARRWRHLAWLRRVSWRGLITRINEASCLLAVSKDYWRSVVHQSVIETGDNARILGRRILVRIKNAKVTLAACNAVRRLCMLKQMPFWLELGLAIRAQRSAGSILDQWEAIISPINRGARGEDNAGCASCGSGCNYQTGRMHI